MNNQNTINSVVNRNESLASKKKSLFRSALLFVILIAMLVSACGGGDTGTSSQPKTVQGWLDLGEELFLKNKYEQAIDAFQKVFDIEPDNIPARIGKAKAYIELGKFDEARGVLLHGLGARSS